MKKISHFPCVFIIVSISHFLCACSSFCLFLNSSVCSSLSVPHFLCVFIIGCSPLPVCVHHCVCSSLPVCVHHPVNFSLPVCVHHPFCLTIPVCVHHPLCLLRSVCSRSRLFLTFCLYCTHWLQVCNRTVMFLFLTGP